MEKPQTTKGKLVIVSGPSGVGKSTICRELVRRLDAHLSVSATTRPKSTQEVDGVDYFFISKEDFENRIDEGKFLEFAKVFDNYYGTPRDKIEEAICTGKIVILEIDVQGSRQVKKIYPDAIMIFILPPSNAQLSDRIFGRARDGAEAAAKRLAQANEEIAAGWQFYKHMVINDNLEQAINDIAKIIESRS